VLPQTALAQRLVAATGGLTDPAARSYFGNDLSDFDNAPADDDHAVSCERMIAAAQVLRGFANVYLDRPACDVSPVEGDRLAEAATLMEQAMDRFS
jgi:hypothetical protein